MKSNEQTNEESNLGKLIYASSASPVCSLANMDPSTIQHERARWFRPWTSLAQRMQFSLLTPFPGKQRPSFLARKRWPLAVVYQRPCGSRLGPAPTEAWPGKSRRLSRQEY